jgi:hypothetical protein
MHLFVKLVFAPSTRLLSASSFACRFIEGSVHTGLWAASPYWQLNLINFDAQDCGTV